MLWRLEFETRDDMTGAVVQECGEKPPMFIERPLKRTPRVFAPECVPVPKATAMKIRRYELHDILWRERIARYVEMEEA